VHRVPALGHATACVRDRWRALDLVVVCTRHDDLSAAPLAVFPDGYRIRRVDFDDETEVAAWLTVHNDAYGRQWDAHDFQRAVLDHPHLRVTDVFLLVDDGGPVAQTAIGYYRRNESIGGGHYSGVVRRAQGIGLGKQMAAYRLHALREAGFRVCENETTIGRTRSLQIGFELGFRPKPLDYWNSSAPVRPAVRMLTDARLQVLYRRWTFSKGLRR
jgi:GNAT superfamily N-acetyltransferase